MSPNLIYLNSSTIKAGWNDLCNNEIPAAIFWLLNESQTSIMWTVDAN